MDSVNNTLINYHLTPFIPFDSIANITILTYLQRHSDLLWDLYFQDHVNYPTCHVTSRSMNENTSSLEAFILCNIR